MSRTLIIAEAGSCHNRDWKTAINLIDTAMKAKADIVKFQTYSSKTLYCKNTPNLAGYNNINKLIKSIELPRWWQKDLKRYCDDCGIEFMSTPFDEKAVDELYSLGVERMKIAGFEATDPRIIRCVAKTRLPIIISLGVGAGISDIKNILDYILKENPKPEVTFLHCNSAYPTPFEDIKLDRISDIMNYLYYDSNGWMSYAPYVRLNIHVGLSDHTEGIFVPPLAVAMGAQVIEKHFTLDRTMKGPDHPFAIEPDELKQMVINIRNAEKCTQEATDSNITFSEEKFKTLRRSVVSKIAIEAGELLTEKNLTTKRPRLENSVPADEYYKVTKGDYKAIVDIDEDTILTRSMVEK